MWWDQVTPLSLPSVLMTAPWSTVPAVENGMVHALRNVPPAGIIATQDSLMGSAIVEPDSQPGSGWWTTASVACPGNAVTTQTPTTPTAAVEARR